MMQFPTVLDQTAHRAWAEHAGTPRTIVINDDAAMRPGMLQAPHLPGRRVRTQVDDGVVIITAVGYLDQNARSALHEFLILKEEFAEAPIIELSTCPRKDNAGIGILHDIPHGSHHVTAVAKRPSRIHTGTQS